MLRAQGATMPRKPRLALAHHPHHIVQRSHSQQAIFTTDADRVSYLATLQEFRRALSLKVYAYCLMDDHIHLVVDPGDDATGISLLMKRLAGRHTRRVNLLQERRGTAWEGRFMCSPIEADRYLLACISFVELNPVRAQLVAQPEEYAWSSYRARAGIVDCEWIDLDPCYLALAEIPELRRERYREFIRKGIRPHELKFIRNAVRRNEPTASAAFVMALGGRDGCEHV